MPNPYKTYDSLPLVAIIIADTVAGRPYTGSELSERSRSPVEVAKIEALRQKMTHDQAREFAEICDARCMAAFEAKAKWFMDCVKAKDNRGRDQLYVWISHWLAAYLKAPDAFRRRLSKALNEAAPRKVLGLI